MKKKQILVGRLAFVLLCILVGNALIGCTNSNANNQNPTSTSKSQQHGKCNAKHTNRDDVTEAVNTCGIGNLIILRKGAIPQVPSVGLVTINLYIKEETPCAVGPTLCLLGDNRPFMNTGPDPKADISRNRAQLALDFSTGDLKVTISPSCRVHPVSIGWDGDKECFFPHGEGDGTELKFDVTRTKMVRIQLTISQSDYPSPLGVCNVHNEFDVQPHEQTGMFDLLGQGSNFPDLGVIQNGKVVYTDKTDHSSLLCVPPLLDRKYHYATDTAYPISFPKVTVPAVKPPPGVDVTLVPFGTDVIISSPELPAARFDSDGPSQCNGGTFTDPNGQQYIDGLTPCNPQYDPKAVLPGYTGELLYGIRCYKSNTPSWYKAGTSVRFTVTGDMCSGDVSGPVELYLLYNDRPGYYDDNTGRYTVTVWLDSQSPSNADLTKVDWNNFTYTSSCYGNTQPFHARDGKATNNGILFQVYTPTYGDLTGDGQPEAAVPYSCTGADFGGVQVFVYSGNATHPHLLGELPLLDPSGSGRTIADVQSVTIKNAVILLTGRGYSETAAHCCPDLHIESSYRWDGSQFVGVDSNVTRLEAGHVLVVKTNTPILDAQSNPISPRCQGPHNDTGAIMPAGSNVVVLKDSHVPQPGSKEYVYVAYPDPCQPGYDFSHNDTIANGSGAVGYIAFSGHPEVQTVTPHPAFTDRGTAWRDCWGPTNCGDATYPVGSGPLTSHDGSVLYAWWTGSYWDPHWWHVDMQGHEAAVYGRDWAAT